MDLAADFLTVVVRQTADVVEADFPTADHLEEISVPTVDHLAGVLEETADHRVVVLEATADQVVVVSARTAGHLAGASPPIGEREVEVSVIKIIFGVVVAPEEIFVAEIKAVLAVRRSKQVMAGRSIRIEAEEGTPAEIEVAEILALKAWLFL